MNFSWFHFDHIRSRHHSPTFEQTTHSANDCFPLCDGSRQPTQDRGDRSVGGHELQEKKDEFYQPFFFKAERTKKITTLKFTSLFLCHVPVQNFQLFLHFSICLC